MARPLKQQKVNKGRIWGLFILGATALFGSTGEHWVAPAGQGGSGVGQPPPLVELYLNFCYHCFWPQFNRQSPCMACDCCCCCCC